FASSVRKKPQRQAGRTQLADAGWVAKQPRSMARVEIADGAQVFVVAGGKCRARTDTALCRNDSAVEFEAELGHGVGLVHVFGAEEFGRQGAKSVLRRRNHRAVFLQAPCHVQQAKQNSGRTYPDEIVKVSAPALTKVGCGQLGIVKLRDFGLYRLL